ncbi:MAG: hypothetical protein ABI165_18855 [Bryobacteraceae bacterium]
MTDAQIQAYLPPLATLIVVAIGFLHNNSRITDLNTNLNKRIDDVRSDMSAHYAHLEKILIGKLDEVEARLDRMEGRR